MVQQHKGTDMVQVEGEVLCLLMDSLKTCATIASQGNSDSSVCVHSRTLIPAVTIGCPNDASTWQKSILYQRVQPFDIMA